MLLIYGYNNTHDDDGDDEKTKSIENHLPCNCFIFLLFFFLLFSFKQTMMMMALCYNACMYKYECHMLEMGK